MTIGRIPSVEGGIQPTIVDAKGDLIAGVAADSVNRLAVGSNDQVLVADSAASTGMAWKSVATPFAAGKNKIINGDFGIWQRGTSFSSLNGTYGPDRFVFTVSTAIPTWTVSQQTFTPGTAPVAGYEGTFFCRAAVTSQGSSTAQYMQQRIEDVRVFAGQTITFSFWAKAASTMTINECKIGQNFGSGGSSAQETAVTLNSTSVGTSWARYTGTITVPSVSGKTIGSSSYVYVYLQLNSSNGNYTFDTWGWQLEAGSVATPFQTATGTLQGELAACQRYYLRIVPGGNFRPFAVGQCAATTGGYATVSFPVTMRTNPTALEQSGTAADYRVYRADTNGEVCTAVPTLNQATTQSSTVSFTVAANLVAGNATQLMSSNATAYLGWSAEL